MSPTNRRKMSNKITSVLAGYQEYNRVPRTLPMKLAAAGGFPATIQCQVSLKNLLTVLQAMAKAGGLGFRVYADPEEQTLYFEVYEGVDRTEGQEDNARVTFSDVYFNIDKPHYTENEANYKNYAIVCGAGEGMNRTIVEVDRTDGSCLWTPATYPRENRPPPSMPPC